MPNPHQCELATIGGIDGQEINQKEFSLQNYPAIIETFIHADVDTASLGSTT